MAVSQFTQHRRKLEAVAVAVIHELQRIPQLQSDQIAITGGLAVMNYAQDYRKTADVDFLITTRGAPQSVKAELLALANSPFQEQAWELYYVDSANKRTFRIDLFSWQDFRFIPRTAAAVIGGIVPGQLPYISMTDLLISKILSCGMRQLDNQNKTDAEDAKHLLQAVIDRHGSLQLTDQQLDIVKSAFDDVVKLSYTDEGWWIANLGF